MQGSPCFFFGENYHRRHARRGRRGQRGQRVLCCVLLSSAVLVLLSIQIDKSGSIPETALIKNQINMKKAMLGYTLFIGATGSLVSLYAMYNTNVNIQFLIIIMSLSLAMIAGACSVIEDDIKSKIK